MKNPDKSFHRGFKQITPKIATAWSQPPRKVCFAGKLKGKQAAARGDEFWQIVNA
jgi:hypothetical protein